MSATSIRSTLDRQGFAGPFPLREPVRAQRVLDAYRGFTDQRNRHVDSPEVAGLIADPGLIGTVERLCGEDLMVWRSAFFAKQAGSPEIGWHHDKHYQTADSVSVSFDELQQHFSVLIAVSAINAETGRFEVIPGSHLEDERYRRDQRPYHLRPAEEHFLANIPEEMVESRQAVDIPAAHFLVFHSSLLHRSLPHPGGPPRLGLAFRLARRDIGVPRALAEPADIVPFGRAAYAPAI